MSQVNVSDRAVRYLLTESTGAINKNVSLLEEKRICMRISCELRLNLVKLSDDFALHN